MNRKSFWLNIITLILLASCTPKNENTKIISPKCRNGQIVIYTRSKCSYCVKLKKALTQHDYHFTEYDLTTNPQIHESLKTTTNQVTVPYVFLNENFIGGYMNFKEKCLSE